MRALVTGGAGFIGSHLAEALVGAGHEVVVFDDLSTGKRENLAAVAERVELQVGCVTDRAAVRRACAGCEAVFHLAAVASVPRTLEDPVGTNAVNLTGTIEVLEAARAAGSRRVVFASSAAVYGEAESLPVREDAFPRPLSPYAVQKLCAEHYVRVWGPLYGMETVALRFFNVFGPRQDPSSPYSGVVSLFVDALRAGRPCTLHGGGVQTRDFIAVADVVRALLRAGTAPVRSGLVCNVARGEGTSVRALYEMLAQRLGVEAAPLEGPPRPGDVLHSVAEVERAAEALGFRAQLSVAEGLAALV